MGICRESLLPKAVDGPSVKSNSITLLSGLHFGKTYGGPEAGGGNGESFPITLGLWVRGIDKIKLRVGRALGLHHWGKETS